MDLRRFIALFIFLLFNTLALHAQPKLILGIFPYTDALQIIKTHQPLREHLENELNVSIEIYTAKSFEQFFNDTQNGLFDILIAPPHFSPIHIESGFVPLVRYNRFLVPIFVVKKESSIKQPLDFKDKTVALSNYLSISSISGLTELSLAGLVIDENVKTINTKTHAAAVQSVLFGESDGAITTHTALKQMESNFDISGVRFIESSLKIPHLFTLASPKLNAKECETLKKALLHFEQSEAGKAFFSQTGYFGYVEPTQADYELLEPFAKEAKKILKQ